MWPARKVEFEEWHAERVVENYEFNLQEELLTSARKEGCTKLGLW